MHELNKVVKMKGPGLTINTNFDVIGPKPSVVKPESNVLEASLWLLNLKHTASPTSAEHSPRDIVSSPRKVRSDHAREITMKELQDRFDQPLVDVAKEFGICITLLKKICRKNGILRWPHRQIRSLNLTIETLQESKSTLSGAELARYEKQLAFLKKKKEEIIRNPSGKHGSLKRNALMVKFNDLKKGEKEDFTVKKKAKKGVLGKRDRKGVSPKLEMQPEAYGYFYNPGSPQVLVNRNYYETSGSPQRQRLLPEGNKLELPPLHTQIPEVMGMPNYADKIKMSPMAMPLRGPSFACKMGKGNVDEKNQHPQKKFAFASVAEK